MDFGELLAHIRSGLVQAWQYTTFFVRTYRGWLISGATILSVLLIVWARFGFTLQIGRFFAFQDGNECQNAGELVCRNGDVQLVSENPDTGNCMYSLYEDCGSGTCSTTGGAHCVAATVTPTPTPTVTQNPGGVCSDKTNCSTCAGVSTPRKDCEGNNTTTRDGIGKNDGTESCSWWKNYGQNWCTTCPYLYRTAKAPKGAAAGDNSVATWTAAGVSQQNLCQEKPDDCPSGWHAWSSSWCEQNATAPAPTAAPTASPGASPTPTPTPISTATPTPTPSPSPVARELQCQPAQQTAQTGQVVTFRALGSGPFSWSAAPDGTIVGGATNDTTSEQMQFTFSLPGEKTVTVRAGGINAICRVTVIAAVQQTLAQLDIRVRNATIDTPFVQSVALSPTQIGEVQVTVFSYTAITNLIVRSTIPAGLSYVPGSTFVDGAGVPDAVAAGGLNLGNVGPAGTTSNAASRIVTYEVRAGAASGFAVGMTQTPVRIELFSGPTSLAVTGNAQFAVQRSGTTQAGQVQTGPGETTFLALIVSILVALMYVSYTRSPLFREQQIKDLSEDRDAIDFRG